MFSHLVFQTDWELLPKTITIDFEKPLVKAVNGTIMSHLRLVNFIRNNACMITIQIGDDDILINRTNNPLERYKRTLNNLLPTHPTMTHPSNTREKVC